MTSAEQRKQERLLDGLHDPTQEAHGVGAVNHAVIVGEREWQQLPRLELPVSPHGLDDAARDPEERDLGPVDDRREIGAADAAQIADAAAAGSTPPAPQP